jgi:two-component system response regulator
MFKKKEGPVRILLAEDNPADVYLIKRALDESDSGYQLDVVSDGENALDFLSRRGAFTQAPTPELIVLDLNLPKYDGAEILQEIRKDQRLAPIPVIILTSSDSPKDRQTVDALGATKYVRKPSSLNEFMAIESVFQEALTPEPVSPNDGEDVLPSR